MKITNPTSRVRTSFDSELELPKLHQWFAENPHPSRLTIQMYVKELNSSASRQSRKLLEVHNLCYWFKNARAAYKRAELRLKKDNDHSQSHHRQQQNSSGQVKNPNSYPENGGAGWTMPSHGLKLTSSSSSPSLNTSNRGSPPVQKSSLCSSPNSIKKTFNPLAKLMMSSSEEFPRKASLGDVNMNAPKSEDGIDGCNKNKNNAQKCFNQHLLCGYTDASTSSSDNGTESPSRADSTSPSSTASLPIMSTSLSKRQRQQQQQQAITTTSATLNNLDLATAVNCLLNTATNFTAAAAAAAAAVNLPSAGSILQSPPNSAAAINLAASILNSNLINVGNQVDDRSAVKIAAALNGRQAAAAAAAAAIANPGVLVEPPMRQLFTAFNPSSYQFALGMLDNKVLDSNILNTMSFPTSACAPDSTFGLNHSSNNYHHNHYRNLGIHNYDRQHHLIHRQYGSGKNINIADSNNLSGFNSNDVDINYSDDNYRFQHHHQRHQYHKSKLGSPQQDGS